jgi:ABC-type transport system involved in multi-copper enzyme maturation permease subunit
MLRVLIAKELHEIMSSTKFVIMVLCVSLLCLATFLNGINSFIESQENIKAGIQDSLNNLQKKDNYNEAALEGYSVYLHLSPMAIYDYGVFRSYGLDSKISNSTVSQLSPRPGIGFQGLNTLGFLDQVTIINSVFSLFAILFSYNLISGERQQGMLRIIFANSVSRNKLLLAKMIGAMLPLWMLVIIPILLGAISIQIFAGVNFDIASMLDLFQLLAISLIYVSTFFLLGLFISCLTKKIIQFFPLFCCCLGVAGNCCSQTCCKCCPDGISRGFSRQDQE